MVLGWQIWETPYYIEGEFHGVWKSDEGKLKDITPKSGISQILFLPDYKAKYEGIQVNNIILNISGNSLVDDLIKVCDGLFYLMNKGDRIYKKELKLTTSEYEMMQLMIQMRNGINKILELKGGKNSLCFCGSQDKYKHCHGKNLLKIIKQII